MEEKKNNNVKGEVLQHAIENLNFEPHANLVVITVNEYESEQGLEVVSETELTIDEWQYVIASGSSRYKPGDKVYLNLKRLVKRVADPNDRHRSIEQIDIIPFAFEDKMLTVIDDNSLLGKMGTDSINIKA